MVKTAKRGEVPSAETYYEIPPQKTGHDYKPTEKDLKIEETVENMEKTGIAAGRLEKDISDTAPKRIVDVLKELALKIRKGSGREQYDIYQPVFDPRFGRMITQKVIYKKDDEDCVEFVTQDSETGEVLESKNYEFMNELPPDMAAKFETMLREENPKEKSN